MAAKYWIKLYIEILDDPKMGMMEDRLFRRTMELFLIAGENNQDGKIPTPKQIAWRMRCDAEQLETEMIELQRLGILSVTDGNWYVTKFAERQEAVSPAERMKRYRERQQKQEYYGSVTKGVTYRNIESDTESESDKDTESEQAAAVFRAYESNIGIMTPMLSEKIDAAIKDYSAEWIIKAIEIATTQEKRSWAYAEGILKRWKQDGFNTNSRKPKEEYHERIPGQVFS